MASSVNGDCFGDLGFHDLAASLLDRPMSIFRSRNREFASEWKAPATALEEKEQAMAPLPHPPPSPSAIASSSSSSSRSGTESVLEIAVYMHGFHNLDLFQQGWYQVKVTSHWESSHKVPGVPSRVVHFDASDLTDEMITNWQISDGDYSFCTRAFHIKYARQDVSLAVMVSFNLPIHDVEWLLCDAVIISFQLLHFAADVAMSLNNISSDCSLCASHNFRIPPKSLIGLHAYCPVYFDTWHRVLLETSIHSVMLIPNYSSLKKNQQSGQFSNGEGTGSQAERDLKNVPTTSSSAQEIALWKALRASFNILMDELKLMESAVGQCADIKVEENASVTFVSKSFTCNLEDKGCIGGKNISLNKQTWNQDLRDSLQLNEKREGMGTHNILPSISRLELLKAFEALCGSLLVLWNTFLKFHRENQPLVWGYLRGIWAAERDTESSLWLIHTKMDIPSTTSIKKHLQGMSHNMQLMSKSVAKKQTEEASVVSASRAELHRKTLEQMKMTYPALQDMQIYHMPAQLPILYVESHVLPAVSSIAPVCGPGKGGQDSLLRTIPDDKGRDLSVVVFVHGFQGHHLDLRLVRSQWLLVDAKAECLMSEINEEKTMSDFRELGHRLAEEVAAFMKKKLSSMKNSTLQHCKLSFVGHSMGNIIIRESLNDPVMTPFHEYLYTFLSISGPHLGFLYNSNILFNSGMWLLKKLKGSPCMHQLSFTDETSIKECYLYKLSEKKTFEHFRNVLLLSSPQDRYVPYHSARVEICQAAVQDPRNGSAFLSMQRNCMNQILKSSSDKRNFIKCDVNFDTSLQSISLNNIIGRTAHIEFLETDMFLRFLMWSFPEFFS